ncbi:MAG: M24 family metallopeptidase [Proteobacteria bacterium]|nr:MAG: M24 family metallopeptidase [Pseudomonadota bacterium]TDJ71617.1 MAG: M24 family metallopeptidase [Pseudomonadota bacterium]
MAFEKSEYLVRIRKTKKSMADQGIDVLLATNPANMNYLTGYDGWSFYVHQLVVLALDSDEPVWIGRGMDANAAKVTTFLNHDNILGYPDDYVQTPVKHPMDYVADFLKEQGWDKKGIGIEMDSYYFTAACYESLKRNLPNADFRDATTLVNWVRVIKSAQEIKYMKQAARIIEKTMQVAVDMVRPGVRQCDAAAAVYQAEISGTEEYGGDYTSLCPMLPTGVGTSTPHLTWTDQPFVNGEATILELAGARHHYHCPMARTVHLGKPPKKLADTAAVVVEGLNNALAAAKPGVECQEVEAVWRETIKKHGIIKESRIGYSTGLNYPPDWGEHTLSLRPGDTTTLQPNMTIHMIPGVWMDDWGIEISECFRVTETGSETLANFPRELFVKD